MAVNKKQFAINSLWKILEQFCAKGISMLVSIFLARMLLPNDYGLIALTAVFTSLSDILIDGGFSTALIRKESVDDYDYSAVFSISSSISILLYIILYFTAPFFAAYYKTPELTLVLRIIGLTFFLQAFTAVRNGIINRNMQFKLLFICNTIASVLSGIAGIVAAYFGWGVWALVVQRLIQQIVLTVLLFIKVKWKIKWKFSKDRIKQMLSFSLGVVGSSLLNFAGGNIYNIAIGKKYSVTDLGYYDKGNQLPMQFSLYTFGAMSNVLLPTIASSQSDLERVKQIIRKVVGMTSFLIIPLMVGLAMISRETIILLFTDKWLPSLHCMQYACLYYLATPYMLINIQVFFALGHSRLRVKTEIIRLLLMSGGLVVFGFMLNCSMNILALVGAVIAVMVSVVTYIEVRKMIHYKVSEVIYDMWKPLVASVIMGVILFLLSCLLHERSVFLIIIIKLLSGATVYIVLAYIMKMQEIKDFIELIQRRRKHE